MTVDKEVLMKLSKEELIQLFDTALQGQVLANDNMSKLGKLLAQAGEKIAQLESDKQTMEAELIVRDSQHAVCPAEVDVDDYVDDKGIRYIGKAVKQPNGKYVCLADVGGTLCKVECALTPRRSE